MRVEQRYRSLPWVIGCGASQWSLRSRGAMDRVVRASKGGLRRKAANPRYEATGLCGGQTLHLVRGLNTALGIPDQGARHAAPLGWIPRSPSAFLAEGGLLFCPPKQSKR